MQSQPAEVPLLSFALTLACGPAQTATPAAAPSAAVKPIGDAALESAIRRGEVPDLSREMNDHYIDALRLEMAIIGADLDSAHRYGASLAQLAEPQGLPDPSAAAPHLAAVRAAGARAASAADLGDAAHALGDLAQACGRCHAATGGGPEDVAPSPDLRESTMTLHLHGAYWMGYALFAPDEDAWRSGVDALTQSRASDVAAPDRVHHIQDLAAAAASAEAEDRPARWAQILLTCAECHGPLRPE